MCAWRLFQIRGNLNRERSVTKALKFPSCTRRILFHLTRTESARLRNVYRWQVWWQGTIKETENKCDYLENNPFFDWQPVKCLEQRYDVFMSALANKGRGCVVFNLLHPVHLITVEVSEQRVAVVQPTENRTHQLSSGFRCRKMADRVNSSDLETCWTTDVVSVLDHRQSSDNIVIQDFLHGLWRNCNDCQLSSLYFVTRCPFTRFTQKIFTFIIAQLGYRSLLRPVTWSLLVLLLSTPAAQSVPKDALEGDGRDEHILSPIWNLFRTVTTLYELSWQRKRRFIVHCRIHIDNSCFSNPFVKRTSLVPLNDSTKHYSMQSAV